MKKKLFGFFIAFCLIFALSLFAANSQAVYLYADDYTISSLDVGLYLDDTAASAKLPMMGEAYQLEFNTSFNENEPISASNTPYKTYFIGIKPLTTPVAYNDLSRDQKLAIFYDLVVNMEIDGVTLTQFQDNTKITTDEYEICYIQSSVDREKLYMSITPFKPTPNKMNIKFNYGNSKQTTIKLDCKYATPTKLTLVTSASYEQLYENYETIVVAAEFNYKNYLHPTLSYLYSWTLEGVRLTNTEPVLSITKDMIKVGNFKLKAEVVVGSLTLDATANIVITTQVPLEATITYTGDLNQTIGENNTPITFKATLPTQEQYNVYWFIKAADSKVFKKQQEEPNEYYIFNTISYKTGTYVIFAQLETVESKQVARSQAYEIILSTKAIEEEKTFTITYKEFNNSMTNITAYECTVDTEDYFIEDNIIWSVDGIQYAIGSSFTFEPEEANEYTISVRLRKADGTGYIQPKAVKVVARSTESSTIWIYILGAGVVMIGLFALAIVISNKKREKIW